MLALHRCKRLAAVAFAALLAAPALALTITAAGPLPSDGQLGDPNNGVITFDYAGPAFDVANVVFSGEVVDGLVGSFKSELEVFITDPLGNTAGWQPALGRTWTGAFTVAPQTVDSVQRISGAPGAWTVQFCEAVDNPGVDATWQNVVLDINPAATALHTAGTTVGGRGWVRPNIDFNAAWWPAGMPSTRLSSIATTVPFHVIPLRAGTTGTYDLFCRQTGWDGFLVLYADAFDPANPLTNCLAVNDDAGEYGDESRLSGVTLTAGHTYFAVVTGLADGQAGAFEFDAFGPGPLSSAGDLNCDGVVNNGDIDAFVLALTDPAGYSSALPSCDLHLGDVNGDALVNNGDIDGFVALVTGG